MQLEVPVTMYAYDQPAKPVHRSFRLTPRTPKPEATPAPLALAQQVRPALVLQETEARALLAAAAREDVSRGGCFSAGPAGIQVWSGGWNGPGGSHGTARLLGSVDWSYDTPARHYITIYRVMVTVDGAGLGVGTDRLLKAVLDLAGIVPSGSQAAMHTPPARDPFRAAAMRARV